VPRGTRTVKGQAQQGGAVAGYRLGYLYHYNNCVPAGISTSADLDAVTDAVLTASRVLVAVAARSLGGGGVEITIPQYRALVVLGARGPQRVAELAEALGIDPSTATRLCDRLVGKGLISRRREDGDRRQVHLQLAPAGRRLLDAVTQRRRAEIRRIVAAVPADRRPAVVQAFTTFSAAAGEVPEAQWPRSWDL